MRISFVLPFLAREGGLELELIARAKLALSSGHEVTVITPYLPPHDGIVSTALADTCIFLSMQSAWRHTPVGKTIFAIAKLKKRIQRADLPDWDLARHRMPAVFRDGFWTNRGRSYISGADILHVFGRPRPFVVSAVRQAQTQGISVVYEEISQVISDSTRNDQTCYNGWSNLCNCVIARTSLQEREFRECHAYRGQVERIDQWAYDNEDELLAIQRPPATPHAGVRIGSISRLSEEKDISTLLTAFKLALPLCPELRLCLAGTGPEQGVLEKLAGDLEIVPKVEFLGHVDQVRFFSQIDVVAITSLQEGGPIVGVEAMAAGAAIISTPVGAMRERIRDGIDALCVPTGSPERLASAIVKVATNSEFRQCLGSKARQSYMVRNHSSVLAPKVQALWSRLSGKVLVNTVSRGNKSGERAACRSGAN